MSTIAASTTTHCLKSPYRVWGKTIEILSCLSEFGGLTPREISEKIMVTPHDVAQTCRRCFQRGFVEPVSMGGYQLSPTGISILSFNNNNNREQIRNKQGTNREQIRNKCAKQFTLGAWEKDRSEAERVVVDALIKHWEKTGSVYVWARDLEPNDLGIPPDAFVDAINDLRRDNVLYTFKDKHSGLMKVGLKESFVERLDYL